MRPGQKVVCVDDSVSSPELMWSIMLNFQQWVKKDVTYTIREILNNDDIVTGVLLKEVVNKPVYIKLLDKTQEPAFATFRFRELDEFEPIEAEAINSIEQLVEEINKL